MEAMRSSATVRFTDSVELYPCPRCGEIPKLKVRKSRADMNMYKDHTGRISCSCGLETIRVKNITKAQTVQELANIWNFGLEKKNNESLFSFYDDDELDEDARLPF